MPQQLIEGVVTKTLKVIPDERGRLMEILRADDPIFEKFGQVYMTTTYPGVVKGWHYHKIQSDHFAVVHGMIKLVLWDARDEAFGHGYHGPRSSTAGLVNEFFIGEQNAQLVKIPPFIMHGFKGIGTKEAIVVNTPTEAYNYAAPDEYRLPPHDSGIPYDWSRRDF